MGILGQDSPALDGSQGNRPSSSCTAWQPFGASDNHVVMAACWEQGPSSVSALPAVSLLQNISGPFFLKFLLLGGADHNTDITANPHWHPNCSRKFSSHPQAFQEYQTPFAFPKAKPIDPVCLPSQIWAHSQPKRYGYVLPQELKRNVGGLDGPEESKRSGPQSIPSLPGAVAAKGLYSCRRKPWLWPGSSPCCPLCRCCMPSKQAGIQLNLCFHLAFLFVLYGILKKNICDVRCSI